jgi:hypothetical protein
MKKGILKWITRAILVGFWRSWRVHRHWRSTNDCRKIALVNPMKAFVTANTAPDNVRNLKKSKSRFRTTIRFRPRSRRFPRFSMVALR